MHAPSAVRNGAPAAAARLLGEVISWTCPAVAVKHVDLLAALRESGLDESAARQLLPRHAFSWEHCTCG